MREDGKRNTKTAVQIWIYWMVWWPNLESFIITAYIYFLWWFFLLALTIFFYVWLFWRCWVLNSGTKYPCMTLLQKQQLKYEHIRFCYPSADSILTHTGTRDTLIFFFYLVFVLISTPVYSLIDVSDIQDVAR